MTLPYKLFTWLSLLKHELYVHTWLETHLRGYWTVPTPDYEGAIHLRDDV
jgi:hypothetical protein